MAGWCCPLVRFSLPIFPRCFTYRLIIPSLCIFNETESQMMLGTECITPPLHQGECSLVHLFYDSVSYHAYVTLAPYMCPDPKQFDSPCLGLPSYQPVQGPDALSQLSFFFSWHSGRTKLDLVHWGFSITLNVVPTQRALNILSCALYTVRVDMSCLK